MRRLLVSLALLFIVAIDSQAIATTVMVYYQPTPFPSKRTNGTNLYSANRHVLMGWLPSNFYGMTFQKDDKLQIGGWGDIYRAYMLFDLEGLPSSVTQARLQLFAYPRGDNSTLTNFNMSLPTAKWWYAKDKNGNVGTDQDANYSWDTSLTWSTQPGRTPITGWNVASLPTNHFWVFDITSMYSNWRSNPSSNMGVVLDPWYNNNNFDLWYSTRYSNDGYRPLLQLTFNQDPNMPNFKLPLPGGVRWLLTNEIGGYESKGGSDSIDQFHQGQSYFSLDINSSGIKDDGTIYPSSNIPVLAAAAGNVVQINRDPNSSGGTGCYVTIDHGSGYYTRYLHFDTAPARANGTLLNNGDHVNQGDQVGLMGNSGISFGKHVHINFWYGGFLNGYSTIPQLQNITMEGFLLKSYQTETPMDANGQITSSEWIRRYHSTNYPTGL
ncbi:MAG: hypothetical protein JWO00_709 [Candidatus Parcubacteria bacterium]|nr:hypothetical protein [Candidatus Parcubacteria bacterium]